MLVTQHSSFAVFGIEGRRFREMVARLGIRHYRDGRLTIVQIDDFVAAVDARAASVSPDVIAPTMTMSPGASKKGSRGWAIV